MRTPDYELAMRVISEKSRASSSLHLFTLRRTRGVARCVYVVVKEKHLSLFSRAPAGPTTTMSHKKTLESIGETLVGLRDTPRVKVGERVSVEGEAR